MNLRVFSPSSCCCGCCTGDSCPTIIDSFDRPDSLSLGVTDTGQAWSEGISLAIQSQMVVQDASGTQSANTLDDVTLRGFTNSFFVEFTWLDGGNVTWTLTSTGPAVIFTPSTNTVQILFSKNSGASGSNPLASGSVVRILVNPSTGLVVVLVDNTEVVSFTGTPAVFAVSGLSVSSTAPASMPLFDSFSMGCL